MIEQLAGFADDIVAIAYHGSVTRQDYETVLIPAVEAALKRHDKVRFYCEVADDFMGFEFGAMWDDWKMGLAHIMRWGAVAVVSDVGWIRAATQAFSPFIPSGVKVFHLKERAQAKAWLGL